MGGSRTAVCLSPEHIEAAVDAEHGVRGSVQVPLWLFRCHALPLARLWLLGTRAAAAGMGFGALAAVPTGGRGALGTLHGHSREQEEAKAAPGLCWQPGALLAAGSCVAQRCPFSPHASLALSCHASPGGRGARPEAPAPALHWWQWQGHFLHETPSGFDCFTGFYSC